jgi:hypothetical protein
MADMASMRERQASRTVDPGGAERDPLPPQFHVIGRGSETPSYPGAVDRDDRRSIQRIDQDPTVCTALEIPADALERLFGFGGSVRRAIRWAIGARSADQAARQSEGGSPHARRPPRRPTSGRSILQGIKSAKGAVDP